MIKSFSTSHFVFQTSRARPIAPRKRRRKRPATRAPLPRRGRRRERRSQRRTRKPKVKERATRMRPSGPTTPDLAPPR